MLTITLIIKYMSVYSSQRYSVMLFHIFTRGNELNADGKRYGGDSREKERKGEMGGRWEAESIFHAMYIYKYNVYFMQVSYFSRHMLNYTFLYEHEQFFCRNSFFNVFNQICHK